MRIWFDTEFIDDGEVIELISIGIVREDGMEFYAEAEWTDHDSVSPWMRDNVIARLRGGSARMSRDRMRASIDVFVGIGPEFWGYVSAYDWVALCQLYGPLLKRPEGWPMVCYDLRQLMDLNHISRDALPPISEDVAHNALVDARWTQRAWMRVMELIDHG